MKYPPPFAPRSQYKDPVAECIHCDLSSVRNPTPPHSHACHCRMTVQKREGLACREGAGCNLGTPALISARCRIRLTMKLRVQLSSVSKFASDVLAMDLPINILLLNAGMYPAQGQTEAAYTADGFEVCFQTNHLSHHLLAKLLLDRVKSSAPARIVTTSSSLHSPSNQRQEPPSRPRLYHSLLDSNPAGQHPQVLSPRL